MRIRIKALILSVVAGMLWLAVADRVGISGPAKYLGMMAVCLLMAIWDPVTRYQL